MASDLYRKCARMLMVGFAGPSMDAELQHLIDDGIFGAIFFKRNIETAEQTADLCREIKTYARRPFLLSVDQEGGRVARLKGPPFSTLPPMRALGKTHDVSLVQRAGELLAYELRAVGFDWNFAPVLDVDTNPKNPVIGDRAFSDSPQEVSRLGLALAAGLEKGGVASCGKHFPGHGDTLQDSHLVLPTLPHSFERLRRIEWVPFLDYAQAGLASVMTAHVIFEALDPGVPATLSAPLLTGILRQELGFQGVIVSDDLEMKAIASHFPMGEAIVRSALAGADLFLVCHTPAKQREAIEALVKAVETGRLPLERVEEAHGRLSVLEQKFFHPPENRWHHLGKAEHVALAQGLDSDFSGRDPTDFSVS